jgi:hypothetical protein
MQKTKINKLAKMFGNIFGARVLKIIRKLATALLTPISWSLNSGHFSASLREKAVAADGSPLPWLTYPAIDFICSRDFENANVLEFGGGQSTLFWSDRTKTVLCFEADAEWRDYIDTSSSENVEILLVPSEIKAQIKFVEGVLSKKKQLFDVILVDGMHRVPAFEAAVKYLNKGGIIICDNAESYKFMQSWAKNTDFQRVDFYGHAPGVLHPHLTTIHFKGFSDYLRNDNPVYFKAYGMRNFPYASKDSDQITTD